jgi:hypothetical protein
MSYTVPAAAPLYSTITSWSQPAPPQTALSLAVTWPAANLAIYVPVLVPTTVVIRKLFFGSESSVATGNYDIGLYNAAGTRILARGSTAKPASYQEIFWDCTDTTIGPGIYYLALAASNNTDTYAGLVLGAPNLTAYGCLTEANAFPLPATATFALLQTLAMMPVVGMSFETVSA